MNKVKTQYRKHVPLDTFGKPPKEVTKTMKRITIHTDDDQIITMDHEWCQWQAGGEFHVVPLETARQAISQVSMKKNAELAAAKGVK